MFWSTLKVDQLANGGFSHETALVERGEKIDVIVLCLAESVMQFLYFPRHKLRKMFQEKLLHDVTFGLQNTSHPLNSSAAYMYVCMFDTRVCLHHFNLILIFRVDY